MAGDIQPPSEPKKPGIIEEWKKASPKEKMFIVGGLALVAVIIWYVHNHNAGSGTPITANAGTVAPAGSGITPMNGVTTSGGGSGTTTVGSTAGQGGNAPTQPTYNGPDYNRLPWGTKFQFGNTLFQLGTGSGGRLWGVPVAPNQTLTQQQFNQVPIGSGKKTLLVAPNGAGSIFAPR